MQNPSSPNSFISPPSGPPSGSGLSSLFQRLKGKRIAYLTLPLLVMATLVEFVILATGWKYQQAVCLPNGMGVTFFGIGPIGATILAVELLKLPLAIWTASRTGWSKGFMLFAGLPLICVLTFQLVKDMAVYEMGTAMAPAAQMLEKASAEEIKIVHLTGELEAIEKKKKDRESKLADLAGRQAKAKADLEESLKHNEGTRQDAITLTEYQKKELTDVEARQATIIKQADADAAQLTKVIADLRASRQAELGRATEWNAAEAKIDNAFKAQMTEYTNKKAAYEKDKAEYAAANFVKRQFLKEPIDPGVPPVKESNSVMKPELIASLDAQLKDKEAELLAVNNKRRDRVAQVDADARRIREDFDRRSSTKREETDRKREAMLAAQATLAAEFKAEQEQIDQELAAAVAKVDGIRAERDAAQKNAESLYESREAAIRDTQVHRIATTVEIVRGLFLGERPMSITATAKERGDILTDQISMVRIWVYPALAFIIAFLPTLMVELSFSTLFKPESQRPSHRLGFLGRRMHALYTRAGRQKIMRAERVAREATAVVSSRESALAVARADAEKALAAKELELQAAREVGPVAAAEYEALAKQNEAAFNAQLKKKEDEWVAKLAHLADSLSRTVVEKDSLRDLQRSEVDRQVQLRQQAWNDRLNQLSQDLDDQRAAAEADRAALVQEHHKKLLEVTEQSKMQVLQVRRQIANAELATVEKSAKLEHDLKEALNAHEAVVAQAQQQAETFALQLNQAQEAAARETEKAARQEKHRAEMQQLEFAKALRQRDDDFQHQLQQREQELTLAYEARLSEEKHKTEQDSRRREAELEHQLETRAREVDARWNQEIQQREDALQIRLKQREQQVQAQAEIRLNDIRSQAEQEARVQKLESERKLDAQSREAAARLSEESQKQELVFHGKLKQREQELATAATARETELQKQWAADLRARQEDWDRQTEIRIRAVETRLSQEAQQKEEFVQSQTRHQDQQWQTKLDALRAEQTQAEQALRRREAQSEATLRELEIRLRQEAEQKVTAARAEATQREENLVAQLNAQAEERLTTAAEQWAKESEAQNRAAIAPIKAQLARVEKEREEAQHSASVALRQAQLLEKKLNDASSFFSDWRNASGNGNGNGHANGNGHHVVLNGR